MWVRFVSSDISPNVHVPLPESPRWWRLIKNCIINETQRLSDAVWGNITTRLSRRRPKEKTNWNQRWKSNLGLIKESPTTWRGPPLCNRSKTLVLLIISYFFLPRNARRPWHTYIIAPVIKKLCQTSLKPGEIHIIWRILRSNFTYRKRVGVNLDLVILRYCINPNFFTYS